MREVQRFGEKAYPKHDGALPYEHLLSVSIKQIGERESDTVAKPSLDQLDSLRLARGIQKCNLPHIFGLSSRINELTMHPCSTYIWPIIPHLFGLPTFITIVIRVTVTSSLFVGRDKEQQ